MEGLGQQESLARGRIVKVARLLIKQQHGSIITTSHHMKSYTSLVVVVDGTTCCSFFSQLCRSFGFEFFGLRLLQRQSVLLFSTLQLLGFTDFASAFEFRLVKRGGGWGGEKGGESGGEKRGRGGW